MNNNIDVEYRYSTNGPKMADIHHEALFGTLESFKRCLDASPGDINKINENGKTPLMCAIINGQIDIVDELLKRGANVNIACGSGYTALHHASYSIFDHLSTIKSLIASGANVNARTIYGETPLHLAVEYGHYQRVIYLLDHGGDHTIKNDKGNNCLMIECDQSIKDLLESYDNTLDIKEPGCI